MAQNQFLTYVGNVKQLLTAIASSAGAGDANKIISTDGSGRIDGTLMPVGIGADIQTVLASEALSAGDFVNVFDNAGTPNVRKADADNNRPVNGFVLSAVLSAANATVYRSGSNTALTGLVAGTYYYLGATAGAVSTSVPALSGNNLVQGLGYAVSTTAIAFQPTQPIVAV
jgi:hypothetical protein